MIDKSQIPTMATIKETAEMFGLAVHRVREMVNSGEIVAVRAGSKFLVNVDRLAEYLNTNTIDGTKEKQSGSSTRTKRVDI